MDLSYICTPSVAFLGTKGALVASMAKVDGVVEKIFLGALPPEPLGFPSLLLSPLNQSHAPQSLYTRGSRDLDLL